MARTPSTMLALGTSMPAFVLPDTDGRPVSIGPSHQAPATLVMFISNHCPYVKHVRAGLADLAHTYLEKGVTIVAIMSNDVAAYPDDRPALMAQEKREAGYPFPYLYDETQEVAKAYQAACTPDFFLFDQEHRLVYRGQLDDSRPGNGKPVTGIDLRTALDAVLSGARPSAQQLPSLGCNIKWKPGNEPAYYR